MAPSRPLSRYAKPRWWAAGIFAAVLGAGALALFRGAEWVDVFVRAARALGDGADIYVAVPLYRYPPFMAFALLPLAKAPEIIDRIVWRLANLIAIAGLIRSAWLLSGATAGALSGERAARERWILAGGIACGAPYLFNAAAHQQVDIIIAALTVAGCLAWIRGRDLWGALLVGLAAAIKGPPLLFVGYLIFRRRWAAAASTFAVAVGANLLPDLFLSPLGGRPRLLVWVGRDVLPTLTGQVGAWNGIGDANQSLAGTVQRLISTRPLAAETGLDLVVKVGHVPETWIKAAAYGLLIALLAASVVGALWGKTRVPSPAALTQPGRTALEMAAMAMFVLLASPMTDLAHMGPVVLPGLCLARLAFCGGEWRSRAALGFALFVGVIVNKDLVGAEVFHFALWCGVGTLGLAALWAGCVSALARGLGEAPSPRFRQSIFDRLAESGEAETERSIVGR